MENPTQTGYTRQGESNDGKGNVSQKVNVSKPTDFIPIAEKFGFNLIKLSTGTEGKSPVAGVAWKPYMTKKANLEALANHTGNFGVVCGAISGNLLVVDYDNKESCKKMIDFEEEAKKTFVVETKRGYHFYFKVDNPTTSDISIYRPGEEEGIEQINFQGEGKLVVAPFSLHYDKEGNQDGIYKIISSVEPRHITSGKLEDIKRKIKEYVLENELSLSPSVDEEADKKIPSLAISQVIDISSFSEQGEEKYGTHPFHGSSGGHNFWVNSQKGVWHCYRHNTGGGVFLLLAQKYKILDCSECIPGALKGTKFKELGEKVKAEFGVNIIQQEKERAGGENSQTELIIKYAQAYCNFLKDEHGKGYVAIKKGIKGVTGLVVWPIRSRDFKNFLSKLVWETEGKALSSDSIGSALNTLQAIAEIDGERHELKLRVAVSGDAILYDTGRKSRELIKISGEGWGVVPHDKPIFKRYSNIQAIVEPVEGARPEDALRLLSHVSIVEKDQIAFMASVISGFIPDIAHVMMIFYGTQGAGKTTACDMIKEVVDPSSNNHLSINKDNSNTVLKLLHNYVASFDNINYLSLEQADILSRAVTGDTQSQRELYTDDEEINQKYKRVIILNGINIASTKPDFQDRALLFEVERIKRKDRRGEGVVWGEFKGELPFILGGIFATLSGAIRIYQEVRSELSEYMG